MKVKVRISSLLRQFSQITGEPEVFEVTASNAMECLRKLVDRFPSMRQWVYDKEGKVLGLMQFFVNGEKLPADELTTPLRDGDELFILFGIGGG